VVASNIEAIIDYKTTEDRYKDLFVPHYSTT
jgi:hypothetical protein